MNLKKLYLQIEKVILPFYTIEFQLSFSEMVKEMMLAEKCCWTAAAVRLKDHNLQTENIYFKKK